MPQCANKRKKLSRGDVFMTSLIFLFILIGTLRLCNTKTLHEAKLTSIFVQETQGFYLLENLMHLARDYAYQIVQNPREPHLFLSASAYRAKDKSSFKQANGTYSDGWVIDFDGSLSKEQIVPGDFPLKIADNGWGIKGGPIFWKDNKKNEHDERYLAEVFMVGSLTFEPGFILDWTMRTVQTMEIERNPLCDFQIYSEGDTTFNTNIHGSAWSMAIEGPVQVNGNTRFNAKNGDASNNINFYNKFNCAGYALYLSGNSISDFVTPKKYHMYDNHENHQVTYGNGGDGFYFNDYALNYNDTHILRLSGSHNNFTSISPSSDMYIAGYNKYNYESYERCIFHYCKGNYSVRSRVYRPIGFDPENYWGFWEPSLAQPAVSSGDGEEVNQDQKVLDFCFGFHNLAQSSGSWGGFYNRTGANNYSPGYAMEQLRGLNAFQMTEKARLVEMQKPINFPNIFIGICATNHDNADNPSLYVPNNFVYSTYINNAFPAIKDNIYLNRYFSLAFQNKNVVRLSDAKLHYKTIFSTANRYSAGSSPNEVGSNSLFMDISDNKMKFHLLNKSESNIVENTVASLKSTFSPTGSGDDSCPPHKLTDGGSYWTLDNYVARVTGEHSHFIYDRNRAKWIQLVDIDIGKLTTALNSDDTWNNTIMPIVGINLGYQQDDASRINKNYRLDDIDIRYNYSSRRTTFFNSYRDGSYVYPNDATHPPVIDIGVRLINARTLPDKGLTFCCPYPVYIKGNFNDLSKKPALIVTDSITLLPDNWQDWRSQMDPVTSQLWYNGSVYTAHPTCNGTTIYADIITGRTHPHFWIQSADTTTGTKQTQTPNPDMGIHDAFRSLCDFNTRIDFHGSLMLPYFCQEQWEPPIDFCKITSSNSVARDPSVYAYPNIIVNPREDVGIPAAMPFYYRINRGRKTHCIGDNAYEVLTGNTLYGKDWHGNGSGYEFSDYHDALPNYLKYEVAP